MHTQLGQVKSIVLSSKNFPSQPKFPMKRFGLPMSWHDSLRKFLKEWELSFFETLADFRYVLHLTWARFYALFCPCPGPPVNNVMQKILSTFFHSINFFESVHKASNVLFNTFYTNQKKKTCIVLHCKCYGKSILLSAIKYRPSGVTIQHNLFCSFPYLFFI